VPHSPARTLGPSAVGSTATSGGAERKRRAELGQVNVAVSCTRLRRLPGRTRRLARYLALVVNELHGGSAATTWPPRSQVRVALLYIQGLLSHFGCISTTTVGMQCRLITISGRDWTNQPSRRPWSMLAASLRLAHLRCERHPSQRCGRLPMWRSCRCLSFRGRPRRGLASDARPLLADPSRLTNAQVCAGAVMLVQVIHPNR